MAGFKGVFTGAENLGKGSKVREGYDIFNGEKAIEKASPIIEWIKNNPKLAMALGIGGGAAVGHDAAYFGYGVNNKD
jgi:hypothetical protein